MGVEDVLRDLGLDRYDRNARLRPALLAVLPGFLLAAVWLPKVWTLFGGLATLVTTCGLTFFLAKYARFKGRQVEAVMVAERGGHHTTLFLRHRDRTISAETKARYHEVLRHQGLQVPSPEDEATDPGRADEIYRSGVDWLLENTRDRPEHRLVLEENIDYGFRRNLVGLKLVGASVATAALATDVMLLAATTVDETRFWAGVALAICLAAALAVWTFALHPRFVDDASRTYAMRLLAQCERLRRPAKTKPRRTRSAPG